MPGRGVIRLLGTRVQPLVHHPMTNVVLGLGLLVTGMVEVIEAAFEGFETVFEAHHGILLFGLVTALRGMLEMLEAAEVLAVVEHDLEVEEAARDRP
jgi:hypothetical protein